MYLSHGRVEVCINGSYGSVCSSPIWDNNGASAVCKQLGFSPYGEDKMLYECQNAVSSFPLSHQSISPTPFPSSTLYPGAVPDTRSFSDEQRLPTFVCTGSGLNARQCSLNSGTCGLYSGVVCQGKTCGSCKHFETYMYEFVHILPSWDRPDQYQCCQLL